MAWNIHWQCCFSSVEGEQYAVNIYEEDYDGNVVQLTGAENPFTTSEDDDTDIFTPIRTQSGYLRVIDMSGDLMGKLVPDNNIQRMVRMYSGTYTGTWPNGAFTESSLKWQGFLQAEAYTQDMGGYDSVEIPLADMLSSLQNIFLPSNLLSDKLNFAKFIISGFDAVSNDTISAIHIVSPIYDTLNDFLLAEIDAKIFFNIEDTSLGLEVIGETYYDTLDAILTLFGLTARMEGSVLVLAQYDYDYTLHVAEYTSEQIRIIANRSQQILPTPTVTSIDISDLLSTIEMRGDNNQISYRQGANVVDSSLMISSENFNFVRAPEMKETNNTYKKITLSENNGRFYVQGGDVVYDPDYAQYAYTRTKNEVCKEVFYYYKYDYVANGVLEWQFQNGSVSSFSNYKTKTIIESDITTIAPYSDHTVYTGAQPARFFYQPGSEYVAMLNGIMLQLKKVNITYDPNYPINDIYHVKSDYNFRFTRGVIIINANCIALKNAFSSPNIELLKDTSSPSAKLRCTLRCQNKYWNGSSWVNSQSAIFVMSFNPDGSIVSNRETYGETYNVNADGYWMPIPTDLVLTGDVELTVWDSVVENGAGPNWIGAFLWDLSISYHACDVITAQRRDKNIYVLKNTLARFKERKSVSQRIGTYNNNVTSPLLITRHSDNILEQEFYIQTIRYYHSNSGTGLYRPEEHLVTRMYADYSITRESINMFIRTGLSFLRKIFTFGNKKYFACHSSIDWRDNKEHVTLIEIQ